MAWIWAVLLMLLFLYLLQELRNLTMKKRLPPGPRGLPILGHFHLLGKNPHRDLYHLARKYGPIMGMHFGFIRTLVISSHVGAELILKTHDRNFANRPDLDVGRYISYGNRNLGLASYGPYWRNMRKLCMVELLSNSKINQFQNMRKAEVGLLVSSLKQAAEMREIEDLSARISALIGDIICLTVFGRKFGDKDLDDKGFKSVIRETSVVSEGFNLADYFPFIGMLDLQGINRKMKELSKIFDGFLEKIIDDHVQNKQEKKQTQDFVDTMMAILESGQAEFEFDRRHVKAVLLDMFVGGMGTSTATVEWALSELIKHPQVMKKLQRELESVVGMDHMVEESHFHKLEYLDCVLKEALRLHPPGPFLIPHVSMEDCVVNGFYIPKTSRALVNVWAIGRDPDVWPDPESFLPDRFVGSKTDLRGHDFQLIPFGSGRRTCPGLQLGLTMSRLALAQLVHCFNWELPNGMLPCDLDMSEEFAEVIARAKPLMAIPNYRLYK